MKLITVIEENAGNRIDKFLIDELGLSRSKIQKLITESKIKVNDTVPKNSYTVQIDDEIIVDDTVDNFNEDIVPQKMDLDIVYEDENLLVINKPSGLVVHPAAGHYKDTLVNGLLYYCNQLSSVNGQVRPGIVHRIDKDTSGLLLVAKNDKTHLFLADQLKSQKMQRIYIALVQGVINHERGTIDAPIGRDPKDRKKMAITNVNSKDAVTHFHVLERFETATLVECRLETGRTHQIRVHFQYINHPLINDPVYNSKKAISDFGQVLHAKTIGFINPENNEYLEFSVPEPKEFQEIVNSYR